MLQTWLVFYVDMAFSTRKLNYLLRPAVSLLLAIRGLKMEASEVPTSTHFIR